MAALALRSGATRAAEKARPLLRLPRKQAQEREGLSA